MIDQLIEEIDSMTALRKWLVLLVMTGLFVGTAILMAADDLKVSEVEKLRVINAYQSAVIAQVDSARANEAVQKAIGSYNAVLDDVRKAHAWPEGTQIQMTPDRTDVTITIPAAKDAKPATPAKPTAPEKKP